MSWLKRRAVQALMDAMPCSCATDYSARQRIDPGCAHCNYGDEILDAIETVAREFAERVVLESRRREGHGPAQVIIAIADKDEP